MSFTRHEIVSAGITDRVRPVLSRFSGTKVAAGAAVLLGVSVLAACTSASNSSGTTPTSNPNTPITTEVSRGGTNTETIVVRDNNPMGGKTNRFMRVRVLAPN